MTSRVYNYLPTELILRDLSSSHFRQSMKTFSMGGGSGTKAQYVNLFCFRMLVHVLTHALILTYLRQIK